MTPAERRRLTILEDKVNSLEDFINDTFGFWCMYDRLEKEKEQQKEKEEYGAK